MTPDEQKVIKDKGYDAYLSTFFIKLDSGEMMKKADYEVLPEKMQQAVMKNGLQAIDISNLKPDAQFSMMKTWGLVDKDAQFDGVDNEGNIKYFVGTQGREQQKPKTYWEDLYGAGKGMVLGIASLPKVLKTQEGRKELWQSWTPWAEEKGERATLAGAGKMAAENLVPFVYAIGHWDDLSAGEKTIILGLDALSMIPVVGGGIRGVSTSVRMGSPLTRSIGKVAGRIALEQVRAPFELLMHPLENLKIPFKIAKEIFGGYTVPYEILSRGIAVDKSLKVGTWGSDLKWTVGGAGEVPGASLEAVGELVKAGQAGTKAETLIGTKYVKLSPTGFETIAGRSLQTTSAPAVENFIDQLTKQGYIEVKGSEKAMFSSVGGTEFWRQAAHGGMGQIRGGLHIEGAINNLPREIAELRDPAKMEKKFVEMASKGELRSPLKGTKQYKGTIEFESLTPEGMKIYGVKSGKTKTFKWKDPDTALVSKSEQLMNQAKDSERMALQAKTVDEANKYLKLTDKYAKESVEAYQEAVKKGTPRRVDLDIDFIETIDPLTGQNLIYLHTVVEGQEQLARPWTAAQRAAWKAKGFINIPRDIFVPALQAPKISPEKQIAIALKRFNPAEKRRFADGLDLIGILNKERPSNSIVKGLKLTDIEVIPKESAEALEKWFVNHDHRIYGSSVEWAQARTPDMKPPGDLDFAINNPEKGIRELADIINATSKDKVIVKKGGFEDMWAIVRVRDGEKIMEAGSIVRHLSQSKPFGLEVAMKSVKIGNFKMERLAEQFNRRVESLLFPGFGMQNTRLQSAELAKMAEFGIKDLTTEGRESFGVVASGRYQRLKDIGKFKVAAEGLISGMREDAKALPSVARNLKLAEADRAEALLKSFLKEPTPKDLVEMGLKGNATIDDYYEAMSKKFMNAVKEIDDAIPDDLARSKQIEQYISDRIRNKNVSRAMARMEAEARFGQVATPARAVAIKSAERRQIIEDAYQPYRNEPLIRFETERTPRLVSRSNRIEFLTERARIPEESGRRSERVQRIERLQRTPERAQERIQSRLQERVADRIPERVPARTPARTPQRVPGRGRLRIPPPRIPPPPTITLPSPDGKGTVQLTEKQIIGLVAWRQGKLRRKGGELVPLYWIKYPDKSGHYPEKNTIHTTDPVEGVIYAEGIGSVAKSIIKKYGEIPRDLEFSMGIQNVRIFKDKTPGIQQPKIRFKPNYKARRREHTPSLAGGK